MVAFQEDGVGDPRLRQVVEGRAAHDPAADDDHEAWEGGVVSGIACSCGVRLQGLGGTSRGAVRLRWAGGWYGKGLFHRDPRRATLCAGAGQILAAVIALMRNASSWEVFRRSLDRVFPVQGRAIPLALDDDT